MTRNLGKGLEVAWWGLKDSTNTPMGKIAVTAKDVDRYGHSVPGKVTTLYILKN